MCIGTNRADQLHVHEQYITPHMQQARYTTNKKKLPNGPFSRSWSHFILMDVLDEQLCVMLINDPSIYSVSLNLCSH